MRCLVLFLLLGSAGSGLAQRTFDVTIADSTCHMKQYWFVLQTKSDAPPMDSLTAAALPKEHLARQGAQAVGD